MPAPAWDSLERDVVERIRILRAVEEQIYTFDVDLREPIWNDVILPNVRLLAELCAAVRIEEV